MTAQLTAGIVNGKCPVTENCRCRVVGGQQKRQTTNHQIPRQKKCSLAVCASKKKEPRENAFSYEWNSLG